MSEEALWTFLETRVIVRNHFWHVLALEVKWSDHGFQERVQEQGDVYAHWYLFGGAKNKKHVLVLWMAELRQPGGHGLKPFFQDNLWFSFSVRVRPNNFKATPDIKNQHVSPLVLRMGTNRCITVKATPLVLTAHQF